MAKGSFAGKIVSLKNRSDKYGPSVAVTVKGLDAYSGQKAWFRVSEKIALELELTQSVAISYKGCRPGSPGSNMLFLQGVDFGGLRLVDRMKPAFSKPIKNARKTRVVTV